MIESIIFIGLGLLLGGLLGFFIGKSRSPEAPQGVSESLHKEVVQNLEDRLNGQEEQVLQLTRRNSSLEEENKFLKQRLEEHQGQVQELQEKFTKEFKLVANQILEENSQKFTKQNQENLGHLLNPLREKIEDFKKKVEHSYGEEQKERVELKTEIKHLLKLNEQLSTEAHNLASALKGNSKKQGDWGEMQLETLLESAGLEKDIHFSSQGNFKDEEGRNQRPDMIVKLPDDKALIIDSKVSLTAYEQYFSTENEEERAKFLKAHVLSLRNHIRDLGSKNYQNLYDINSPDYVMLFIPIEPAFSLAIQEEKSLFTEALDKNIVLVTSSTLLATMRTVSFIWKQENQKKNVLEIAKQGGDLYDKFTNFVEDLTKLGNQLGTVQKTYGEAMKKLVDGKGNLIRRAENLKALGAKTSKQLPNNILDRAAEE